jgi:hypothetical protein
LSERDAIRKILTWSEDGVSVTTETNKRYEEKKQDWNELHLNGLRKYEFETFGPWILDKDSNHISHKYTEQESHCIVDLLMEEDNIKNVEISDSLHTIR